MISSQQSETTQLARQPYPPAPPRKCYEYKSTNLHRHYVHQINYGKYQSIFIVPTFSIRLITSKCSSNQVFSVEITESNIFGFVHQVMRHIIAGHINWFSLAILPLRPVLLCKITCFAEISKNEFASVNKGYQLMQG